MRICTCFTSRERTTPDLLEVALSKAATNAVLEAIDATVPGGIDGSFHDFALQGWNQAPAALFSEWDDISHRPAEASIHPLVDADGNGTYILDPLTADPSEMSVNYLRVEIPEESRRITIDDPFILERDGFIRIQLLVWDGAKWELQDGPGDEGLSLCQEFSPVETVVVVISATTSDLLVSESVPQQPLLTFEETCGITGDWAGESHSVRQEFIGDEVRTYTTDATDVVFQEFDCSEFGPDECFETVGGTVRFTFSGYWVDGCTAEGEFTRQIEPGEGYLHLFPTSYTGQGLGEIAFKAPISCGGNQVGEGNVAGGAWLSLVFFDWPDHNIIEGGYHQANQSGTYDSNWRLVRLAN